MANQMRTMAGCCCGDTVLNDCTEINAFIASISEGTIDLDIDTGCMDCNALSGVYVVQKATPQPLCLVPGDMSYLFDPTVAVCEKTLWAFTIGMACFTLSPNRLVLTVRSIEGTGADCRVIATKNFDAPFSVSSVMSGTIPRTGATEPACRLASDVPYSLAF